MRMRLFLILHLMVGCVLAQTESSTVLPRITTVSIEQGAVTVLHLGIGYITAVRVPEEIGSVVLGNPSEFQGRALRGRAPTAFSETNYDAAG